MLEESTSIIVDRYLLFWHKTYPCFRCFTRAGSSRSKQFLLSFSLSLASVWQEEKWEVEKKYFISAKSNTAKQNNVIRMKKIMTLNIHNLASMWDKLYHNRTTNILEQLKNISVFYVVKQTISLGILGLYVYSLKQLLSWNIFSMTNYNIALVVKL